MTIHIQRIGLTLSTWGCEAIGAPASGPRPVIMFRTPEGSPTSSHIAPSSKQVLFLEKNSHGYNNNSKDWT